MSMKRRARVFGVSKNRVFSTRFRRTCAITLPSKTRCIASYTRGLEPGDYRVTILTDSGVCVMNTFFTKEVLERFVHHLDAALRILP